MTERQCLLLTGADWFSQLALVSTVLVQLGYRVTQFGSATEAISRFDPNRFEIVVIDLHPVDMNGLEVLRKLKSHSPDTPVIVLVGKASDVVQALHYGANAYLLNSIADETVIKHTVTQIIKIRSLSKQNHAYRTSLAACTRDTAWDIESLQRDYQAGKLLQQRLLPRTPYRYPVGIEVAYQILPSLYLSGDFIDYGLFGKRFVAFYLVDVSGHGVTSALVAALIKQSIIYSLRARPLFCQPDALEGDLLNTLKMINRELLSAPLQKHASMFAGVIDSHTQQLYYTVAGQLPMPALITATGAEWLPGRGRPLGLFHEGDWEVRRCQLSPNWQLVACSDGVLELLSGDLLHREAQLLDLIGSSRGELNGLCSALKIGDASMLVDDISILTLCQSHAS